jgi:predicted dehydrogenase
MGKINVAVIGVGYWGKKIASEYAALGKGDSNVSLYGVCDILEDNLTFCRENYSIPQIAKYHKEILTNSEIDAVHICTPSVTHFAVCKEALEAGKHVIVEKPMTLDSLDAHRLVELAQSNNLVLSVGHIFRFDAALEKVKNMMASRFFGDLFWLKLQWTALMPLMEGRDIITDLAPHPYDILNFLTDEWPLKITCIAKAHRKGQQEETAHIIAELKNNVMANIELSWLYPGKIREVSVMGSERFAKIDCLTQEITAFENDRFYRIPVEKTNTINAELTHFVECIRNCRALNNGYPNKNGGLVGANVVRLLEITKNSMKNERTERVQ